MEVICDSIPRITFEQIDAIKQNVKGISYSRAGCTLLCTVSRDYTREVIRRFDGVGGVVTIPVVERYTENTTYWVEEK